MVCAWRDCVRHGRNVRRWDGWGGKTRADCRLCRDCQGRAAGVKLFCHNRCLEARRTEPRSGRMPRGGGNKQPCACGERRKGGGVRDREKKAAPPLHPLAMPSEQPEKACNSPTGSHPGKTDVAASGEASGAEAMQGGRGPWPLTRCTRNEGEGAQRHVSLFGLGLKKPHCTRPRKISPGQILHQALF